MYAEFIAAKEYVLGNTICRNSWLMEELKKDGRVRKEGNWE